MGIITAIEPQKKNKDRVSIFVDGSFVCGLSLFTLKKFRLTEGAELSEGMLDSVIADSECDVCFDMACRLIANRRKTVKEVEDHLKKKGFDDLTVDCVIKKLIDYHFVDDVAYVRDFIATYRQKYGIYKLKFELKNKGVSDELVEGALSNIGSQYSEASLLAEKYLRTHPKADKKKTFAFLHSKGFDYDDISEVIDHIDFKELTDEN